MLKWIKVRQEAQPATQQQQSQVQPQRRRLDVGEEEENDSGMERELDSPAGVRADYLSDLKKVRCARSMSDRFFLFLFFLSLSL